MNRQSKVEKTPLITTFIYEGLGFPVRLINVPMIEIRGNFVPDIDFNKLQKAVLLHLCHKKTPLTGYEIKFIRKYFRLTTTAFGHLFGYTHSAVLKWENREDLIAKIAPTTEVYLRLYIFEFLKQRAKDFKQLYEEISIPQLAEYLKKPQIYKHIPLSINATEDLVFVT